MCETFKHVQQLGNEGGGGGGAGGAARLRPVATDVGSTDVGVVSEEGGMSWDRVGAGELRNGNDGPRRGDDEERSGA